MTIRIPLPHGCCAILVTDETSDRPPYVPPRLPYAEHDAAICPCVECVRMRRVNGK
jgi:hypothetical protein